MSDQEEKPRKAADVYSENLAKANEKKRILAVAASRIIENPSTECGRLKEMLSIFQTIDIRCNGQLWHYAAALFCELYKDILPSYYVRVATETEKKQKAKKETKQLREHEEQLLSTYKK